MAGRAGQRQDRAGQDHGTESEDPNGEDGALGEESEESDERQIARRTRDGAEVLTSDGMTGGGGGKLESRKRREKLEGRN